MAIAAGSMFMGYTTTGLSRISDMALGLKFVCSSVQYGEGGHNPAAPQNPLALDPSQTGAAGFAFELALDLSKPGVSTIESFDPYTLVVRSSLPGLLYPDGKALSSFALMATVTDSGSTGVTVGTKFALALANTGRVWLPGTGSFALDWPMQFVA